MRFRIFCLVTGLALALTIGCSGGDSEPSMPDDIPAPPADNPGDLNSNAPDLDSKKGQL